MGYYFIQRQPPSAEVVKRLVLTAFIRFKALHEVGKSVDAEVNMSEQTITITSGESVTFTFEELGYDMSKAE